MTPPLVPASEGARTTDRFAVSCLAGLLAGASTGLIDGVWSLSRAQQFVEGSGLVRFVAYLITSYALAAALVGLLVHLGLAAVGRATRLNALLSLIRRAHATRREKNPASLIGAVSIGCCLVPSVGASLVLSFGRLVPLVAHRKSISVSVAVVMVAAVLALVAGIGLALFAGRVLELLLRRLASGPRSLRLITWSYFPLAFTAALAVPGLIGWVAAHWSSPIVRTIGGPLVVALLGACLFAPSAWIAKAALARLRPTSRVAYGVPVLVLAGSFAGMLATSSDAVLKANAAYSELGAPITRSIRRVLDFDRDGYSSVLGGGDCNDRDAGIHPRAHDVPHDHIDQDCLGGDGADPNPTNSEFASVPSSVPADLNILLITVDTLRADHLGAYGYPRETSPALDKLAGSGFTFLSGWAHASSTAYSIPSILTGRLPLAVRKGGLLDGFPYLDEAERTIAEALRPLGFRTGAVTNHSYFASSRNLDQGFDEYDNGNAVLHRRAEVGDILGTSAKEQSAKALDFIDRHRGERWFLWVHYLDPHYRYVRHDDVPDFGGSRVDLYDGEIRYTDDAIGALLEGLRARGLFERTAVVVTSDHGESFDEHGLSFHAQQLYAPQTKVPFLIRVPGLSGRRSSAPVAHIDLLPTLINLAGGTRDAEMMGRSLLGVMTNADDERPVFQQLTQGPKRQQRGVVTSGCHVIYNLAPDVSWEAYRLDVDPLERSDVSSDATECVEARRALEQWCNQGGC